MQRSCYSSSINRILHFCFFLSFSLRPAGWKSQVKLSQSFLGGRSFHKESLILFWLITLQVGFSFVLLFFSLQPQGCRYVRGRVREREREGAEERRAHLLKHVSSIALPPPLLSSSSFFRCRRRYVFPLFTPPCRFALQE